MAATQRGARKASAAPVKVTPTPMSNQLLDTHIMPAGVPPDRRALFSIIYNGYRRSSLEPCGCVSHKLGGIDREAKVLERLTTTGMPLVKLEAGGYVRDMAEQSDSYRIASQYLLKALAKLDYDVFNVGAPDIHAGKEFLEQALGPKADRLISANVVDPATSTPLFLPYRIVPVTLRTGETVRVGVVGITRPRFVVAENEPAPRYAVAEPVASLKKVLPELQKKSDIVILLAYMNRDLLTREVLERLGSDAGVDIAIAGEFMGARHDIQNVQGIRVVSGGFEGRQVGHVVLEWRDGKLTREFNKLVEIEQTIPQVPEISELISDYLKELVRVSQAPAPSTPGKP